jgi:hypothetical protein
MRVIGSLREISEPKEAKDEEEGEDENAVNHFLLGREMHENGRDQSGP